MRRSSLVAAILFLAGIARAEGDMHDVVLPPRVIESVEASLPEGAGEEGGTVILLVTVGADGLVREIGVDVSVAPALDEAAAAAVRKWRFEPARRNGEPVASKVRVPYVFRAPEEALAEEALDASEPSRARASEAHRADADEQAREESAASEVSALEVSVIGRALPPPRSASEFTLDRALLASAPRRTAADVLKSAPGLYLSEPEGRGGPPQIFLRGFDTEHGRDLEVLAGGIPLNQPAQIHAHGAVELGAVLPDVVREVRVREGIYDPRQGEFAIAGSIEYELGVVDRGVRLSTRYGEHRSFGFSGVYAPEGEDIETFGAFSYERSRGATRHRGFEHAGGIGRYAFPLGSRARAIVHVASFAGETRLPGVLREDDIDPAKRESPSSEPSYRLGGTYDDPSARQGGVSTARTELSITVEAVTDAGGRFSVMPYIAHTSFALRENFSGYLLGGPDAFETGRADFHDERNDGWTFGATAFYRTPRHELGLLRSRFELGTQVQSDTIEQTHSLLFADGSAAWREITDASISHTKVAGYADADIGIGRFVRLRGGARADLIAQSLDDRVPQLRSEAVPGVRKSAQAALVSPRAAVEVLPTPWLTVSGGYGEGFRSAPPSLLRASSSTEIARARSHEIGAAVHTPDKAAVLKLIGFRTTMSDDLGFDPSTGTLESIGASARTGLVASLRASAFGWLESSTSVTYAHTSLEDHDEDDGHDHDDEGEESGHHHGTFAPKILARNDLVASFEVGEIRGAPVRLSLGSAQTLLGRRALSDGSALPAVFLLDASARARWQAIEIGLTAENLLDARYVDAAYVFESRWNRSRATPGESRHLLAGPPRTLMGTLTLHL